MPVCVVWYVVKLRPDLYSWPRGRPFCVVVDFPRLCVMGGYHQFWIYLSKESNIPAPFARHQPPQFTERVRLFWMRVTWPATSIAGFDQGCLCHWAPARSDYMVWMLWQPCMAGDINSDNGAWKLALTKSSGRVVVVVSRRIQEAEKVAEEFNSMFGHSTSLHSVPSLISNLHIGQAENEKEGSWSLKQRTNGFSSDGRERDTDFAIPQSAPLVCPISWSLFLAPL